MDLQGHAHYVAFPMELLLILSAMLSVVTGAFAGVRGPEARVHQAEAAVGAQVAVAAVEQQAPLAPALRPPSTELTREVLPLPRFAIAAAIPRVTDRLIE